MKLRFTTKLFVFSTVLYIAFRTLQIIFLTTSETAFLTHELLWLNVLLTVLCLVPLLYTAANAYYAFRCPKGVGKTGVCGVVVGLVSGILMLVPVIKDALFGTPTLISILLPALGAISCFWMAGSELFGFELHKAAFLPLLVSSLYGMVDAYSVYTGHPLRARTVYEIIAIALSVFFFLYLCKAHSMVKQNSSFRFLYPLGVTAAAFCFIATIPEIIAYISGYSQNIAKSSTSPFMLLSFGILATYLTLTTNKIKNTSK